MAEYCEWGYGPPRLLIPGLAGGYGLLGPLARLLGITHNSIMQWRRVPAARIIQIEAITGVPRDVLRPEFYEGYEAETS